MTLLEKCQKWHEQDKYQQIVDAVSSVPEEERTPELELELARAYNNLANPETDEGRELLRKSIGLLLKHKEQFKDTHSWNFRVGYAYYYLDEEGPALKYFTRSLELHPGDDSKLNSKEEIQGLIDDCRQRLMLPRFKKSFRQRTKEAWEAFAAGEAELRSLLDARKQADVSDVLVNKCSDILQIAFSDPAFEIGFNGEKYKLILTPEGSKADLFALVYFAEQAPAAVRKRWKILAGRQPSPAGSELRLDSWSVAPDEVRAWAEVQGENEIKLTLYCSKLLPLLVEHENKAWWILSALTDQVLGEVAAMSLIKEFNVEQTPQEGDFVTLADLPNALLDLGIKFYAKAGDYLENSYFAYSLEPVKDEDADWRLDVYTGSTCCTALVSEYLRGESDTVDTYHREGIAAGFLIYPLAGFEGEERAKEIIAFRDELLEFLEEKAGKEAYRFIGGATGLYCGYVDFIAWDLPAVLDAAAEFFDRRELPWASFHSFRRDVGTIRLLSRDEEPELQLDPQTGSLLSRQDIAALESFDEGDSGYFYKMLDYLRDFIQAGVDGGRFSMRQARADLQIALWYAFACNNIDEYDYYYKAVQWMPASEKHAAGCGMWYYRYSAALMYCGMLDEALAYAEQGAKEEPDYIWIWLQVAKLRSHFGDREGALAAARQGLRLKPGDYEFLTLEQEILAGASLEQMTFHWINPAQDGDLQNGLDQDGEHKRRVNGCITVDADGLAAFKKLFAPLSGYEKDTPYCIFNYPVQGQSVELAFGMNEAGLSKLDYHWLLEQKKCLDSGLWLKQPYGRLETVFFNLDYKVALWYRQENGEYRRIYVDDNGKPIEPQADAEE